MLIQFCWIVSIAFIHSILYSNLVRWIKFSIVCGSWASNWSFLRSFLITVLTASYIILSNRATRYYSIQFKLCCLINALTYLSNGGKIFHRICIIINLFFASNIVIGSGVDFWGYNMLWNKWTITVILCCVIVFTRAWTLEWQWLPPSVK